MEKIWEYISKNKIIIKKIILSDSKTDVKKIIVHPIELKGEQKWQIEKYVGAQVFHSNVDFENLKTLPFDDYKQITVEATGTTGVFSATKTGYKLKEKQNNIKQINLQHNKQKQYFINEGDDVPALVDLGIFTRDGKIVASMYDKFKQINKFIEIIDASLKNFSGQEITILGFGCGKSYLTFLIYYYFEK